MDLQRKLSQASVWPTVTAIAAGERPRGPLVVELDLTSFCDLACPGCISADLLNSARFSSSRLHALVGELVDLGVRAVVLIGGGEPLMHSAVGEVIQRLSGGGMSVGLTTNGTRLMRHLDVIAQCVSWTRVSVDAGTEATYGQFRPSRPGRNEFNRVIAGMRELARVKNGTLGYSFMLDSSCDCDGHQTSNLDDILQAARLARDIGCDYFELKPRYDDGHFLIRQPRVEIDRLGDILSSLAQLTTDSFQAIAPTTLQRVAAGLPEEAEMKTYHTCPVASLRTLITPSGAYICPYHRGRPAARYGDPQSQSLADMWTGDALKAVRDAIDPTTDCQFHCIRHGSNLVILDSLSHSPDVVDDYDPFI